MSKSKKLALKLEKKAERCYMYGNYGGTHKYFIKSFEEGNIGALHTLAIIYLLDDNLHNHPLALKYLTITAHHKHPVSCSILLHIYLHGSDCCLEPDIYSAIELLEFIKEEKIVIDDEIDDIDEYVIDRILNMGIELYEDDEYCEAFEYFEIASDMGNHLADYYLGEMYYFGYGVDENNNLAYKYIQKAANDNINLAQDLLGTMYHRGHGVDQDFVQSLKYYSLAIRNGHIFSGQNVAQLFTNSHDGCKGIETMLEDISKKDDKISELEKRVKELEKENTHLKFKPGGPMFEIVKKDFEDLQRFRGKMISINI